MRGIGSRAKVEWDIAPVPHDGGLPAGHAIVSRPLSEPGLFPGVEGEGAECLRCVRHLQRGRAITFGFTRFAETS